MPWKPRPTPSPAELRAQVPDGSERLEGGVQEERGRRALGVAEELGYVVRLQSPRQALHLEAEHALQRLLQRLDDIGRTRGVGTVVSRLRLFSGRAAAPIRKVQ